jgi:hypothetical protein
VRVRERGDSSVGRLPVLPLATGLADLERDPARRAACYGSREVVEVPTVAFIAGWGRSGSTLLGLALGECPGAVYVGEVRDLWTRGLRENRLCGCGAPFRDCAFWAAVGDAGFGGWDRLDIERVQYLRRCVDRPWNEPSLRSAVTRRPRLRVLGTAYAEVLRALYRGIREVSGAEIVVDSSKIASHALLLKAAGLPVEAVHLVRDSRGVVHSWRKTVLRPDGSSRHGGVGARAQDRSHGYLYKYGTATASLRYLLYNAMASDLARCGIPVVTVRYEDLVAAPVATLRSICRSLHLEHPDGLLGMAAQRRLTLQTSHTVDGNPLRLRARDVSLSLDDAWHVGLPVRDRAFVTTLTFPLLARYGYLSKGGSARAPGFR